MDRITACAVAFEKICGCEYDILLGRKGVSEHIRLVFTPEHFFHLAGLHKLQDMYELKRLKHSQIWVNALSGRITDAQLMKSYAFCEIEGRIDALTRLEAMLDSDDLYFKYNKNASGSKIAAKYLIVIEDFKDTIYLFLDKTADDAFFCRSIFPKDTIDYTERQTKLTLLRKEKRFLSSDETILLYNRDSSKAALQAK